MKKRILFLGLASILLFITGCQSNTKETTEHKIVMMIQSMKIMYIRSMILM